MFAIKAEVWRLNKGLKHEVRVKELHGTGPGIGLGSGKKKSISMWSINLSPFLGATTLSIVTLRMATLSEKKLCITAKHSAERNLA